MFSGGETVRAEWVWKVDDYSQLPAQHPATFGWLELGTASRANITAGAGGEPWASSGCAPWADQAAPLQPDTAWFEGALFDDHAPACVEWWHEFGTQADGVTPNATGRHVCVRDVGCGAGGAARVVTVPTTTTL